jgi:hypothetical protein
MLNQANLASRELHEGRGKRTFLSLSCISFYFSIFLINAFIFDFLPAQPLHTCHHTWFTYTLVDKSGLAYAPASNVVYVFTPSIVVHLCSNIHLPSSTVHPQPLLVSIISLVLFLVGLFSYFLLHSIEVFSIILSNFFLFFSIEFCYFPKSKPMMLFLSSQLLLSPFICRRCFVITSSILSFAAAETYLLAVVLWIN